MKWKTQFNANDNGLTEDGEVLPLFPRNHEVNNGISMTIPGRSLTIKQLMQRHAAGLPLEDIKTPLYYGEEETPELNYGDPIDHMQTAKDIKAEISRLENQLKEEKEAAKRKKAEQREKVQRTTGEKADQSEKGDPAPNILKKPGVQGQRPATKQSYDDAEG